MAQNNDQWFKNNGCLCIGALQQKIGNFINVLLAAFVHADPESAKKTDSLTVFFALLGSACITAARKMLMKFTHYIDFANSSTFFT